jgi:Transglutaminase-like superfamily
MRQRLRSLLKLDGLLLVHCWLRLLRVRLSLAVLGFDRTLKKLKLRESLIECTAKASPAQVDQWRTRGTYLQRAAKITPGAFCLARSLTLCHWARLQQLPVQFVMGAKQSDGQSTAHAWCELDDQIIDDTQAVVASFKVIFRC